MSPVHASQKSVSPGICEAKVLAIVLVASNTEADLAIVLVAKL